MCASVWFRLDFMWILMCLSSTFPQPLKSVYPEQQHCFYITHKAMSFTVRWKREWWWNNIDSPGLWDLEIGNGGVYVNASICCDSPHTALCRTSVGYTSVWLLRLCWWQISKDFGALNQNPLLATLAETALVSIVFLKSQHSYRLYKRNPKAFVDVADGSLAHRLKKEIARSLLFPHTMYCTVNLAGSKLV